MMRFLRRRKARKASSRPAGSPESAGITEPREVEAEAAARARTFWQRWQELLPELSAALGEGASRRMDHQLAEAVALVHPKLTFSIERGTEAVHALVVSAQADPELRPYTDAWRAHAPDADDMWEYHDAIPAVPDPTQVTVNLQEESYALSEVRLAPQVDESEGLVDVAVFHPKFRGLDEAARNALTFLPLDAALGERLAVDRLGRVETAENEPAETMDLIEFRALVRQVDGQNPA